MRTETKEFIENWNVKLSEIKNEGNSLKELYDKFVTLFTIYNRYYNEAYHILETNNQLQRPRYSDYEKATNIVMVFLDSQVILDSLIENGNQHDIDSSLNLIGKVFNINLANGDPQEETDKQLVANLKSVDTEIKTKAVLSLIYNVRCNIIHGYKDFQEYQRLLVEPLINMLQTMTGLFKSKLG